ncbi:MAG: Xaa-Pro peptidase family protein [Methanomicrobiaceae archaeon]|uniref:Xaa-pro aminopeptidase n=1 Tax=hydrocarbon metagenome TaxID=938273 RepID=A0A0W8FK46_9ZZZZ|nr:Xaa-Pro peptidase family protein [Methanomicrobiaceae archaeon]MDD5419236.1 Xaa-Pro peptidase family protein [Methanomicrobiaceae archaeon]
MNGLDTAIREADAAAYVVYASSQDANMRYLTRFRTTDPVVYIRKPGERGTLIVPQMEYERAVRESPAAVITRSDAGLLDFIKEGDSRMRATARMIAGQAGGPVLVPAQFPLGLARELEAFCPVLLDAGTVESMRAVKTSDEMDRIRTVQRAAEQAIDLAVTLIRKSRGNGGILVLDGEPLTSERVKTEMHRFLFGAGCRAVDTIVSCGGDTALPHHAGSGPLQEDEPIVIDIFPQDEASGYHADMTRTVVKGEAAAEIIEMHRAVREAKALGESMLRPGVSGAEVYQRVVDFFGEQGYESTTEGFLHSLGHGIGLEVHERPFLGPQGETLSAGNVVTVEPGLYYRGIGGVRIEDLGALDGQGFRRFTRYGEELLI